MLARTTAAAAFLLSLVPDGAPRTYGSVAGVVRERDLAPKTSLDAVLARPHAHALGSLSSLRGEITILDGRAWLAYPPDGVGAPTRIVDKTSTNEGAAFLVAKHVAPAAWKRIALPDALTSRQLEAALATYALKNGLGERAFAFRIDGKLQTLTLAIIDGRKLPPGKSDEEALATANVLETVTNVQGSLVGFYTPATTSAFTHPGAHAHVHAVVPKPLSGPGKPASGHAQEFALAPGSTLWLEGP